MILCTTESLGSHGDNYQNQDLGIQIDVPPVLYVGGGAGESQRGRGSDRLK